MVGSINTSGISVGSDGKLQVSGFSSGIDWKSIVDAQMAAKRITAVTLETKAKANNEKITAYGEMKTKVAAVTTALNKLRAAPGSTDNVFLTKSVTGTSAAKPTAPSGFTPSSVSDMMIVSVGSTAQNATHTITVNQLAQAHQIRADAFTATNSALTGLGATAGTFTINGESIVLSASDTLLDLRSKINTSSAGVTATIVSANATTNYLVLTAEDTGVANEIVLGGSGATLDSLGLTTTVGTVLKNELVQGADADIDVDGVTGITRSSNQIDDVITGVTFSLLKAEEDTTMTLKIEPDLAQIKTALSDFVTAYNDVRSFATAQRTAADRNSDGVVGDNEVGVLAYDQTMRTITSKLADFSATSITANDDGFQSLGQLGIVTNSAYELEVDDTVLDNKLLTNIEQVRKLFALEVTTSDSRMTFLSRTQDTQSGTYYVNIAGTDGDGYVTSANIQTATVVGNGGADDGSMTGDGKVITAASGDAEGAKWFFNGGASLGVVNDIEITISRGLADQFYDYFNDLTKATSGTMDTLVGQLQEQNTSYQDRVEVIDTRLAVNRASLEAKFVAMETALARLTTLQSTLDNYTSQNNKSN